MPYTNNLNALVGRQADAAYVDRDGEGEITRLVVGFGPTHLDVRVGDDGRLSIGVFEPEPVRSV